MEGVLSAAFALSSVNAKTPRLAMPRIRDRIVSAPFRLAPAAIDYAWFLQKYQFEQREYANLRLCIRGLAGPAQIQIS
jgi:hypothetical protein